MTVLYLKYRPKQFNQLDNSDARESLIKIFNSDNIPHALLFTGPKGIGKTSAARIAAKSLNCQNTSSKSASYEPCNECDVCRSIDNGSNVDVFEIDAASNRGIDDIRELRDKIKLSPAQSKNKIYIIDEVHMLTTESFNALLKTLEEPPKHAFFILCTTDYEKLPKTIVSRCTRIHFKKATKSELVKRLQEVAKSEGLITDAAGLAMLVNYSEGSFRDAIKLLDQASSLGVINQETVMKIVGLNSNYSADELLELIENNNIKEVIGWLNKANEAEVNFKLLIQGVVERLRLLMLKSFGVEVDTELREYVFSLAEIQYLVRLLQQAMYETRQAIIPSLPLEMAIVDYFAQRGKGDDGQRDKKEAPLSAPEKVSQDQKIVEEASVSRVKPNITTLPQEDLSVELTLKWPEILAEVKPLNHSVLAFLRASRPVRLAGDGSLVIEVFYQFHKDQLETDRSRKIFESAASKVLDLPVKLKCILGENKPRVVSNDEPVYEVKLAVSPLPKKDTDDIIDIAEQIFNGGTIQ